MPQQVEIVAVDRKIWEGEADLVRARTLDGEIGVLANHAPLLGVLVEGGVVTVRRSDGDDIVAAVHGGFISVQNSFTQILAESAELAGDIDVSRARQALERARSAGDDDEEAAKAAKRAEARLTAAGETVDTP